MALQSSMIADFVAGRLDDECARQIERASWSDARLAAAISAARTEHRRIKSRMALGWTGSKAAPAERRSN